MPNSSRSRRAVRTAPSAPSPPTKRRASRVVLPNRCIVYLSRSLRASAIIDRCHKLMPRPSRLARPAAVGDATWHYAGERTHNPAYDRDPRSIATACSLGASSSPVSAPDTGRRLLEFRVRLHGQCFNGDDLFRPAVLDVFELVASAKVRFRSRLCIIGRLGQERDVVLLDDAETHPVAVQLTLLAQGDPAERGVCEVILMPSGVWSLTCSETAGTRALVDMVWAAP